MPEPRLLHTIFGMRRGPGAIIGAPARGVSSGQSLTAMEDIAKKTLPSDVGYQWTAMSFQEKLTGNQLYYLFGSSVLLVYLCLANQYESWILPLAVLSVSDQTVSAAALPK